MLKSLPSVQSAIEAIRASLQLHDSTAFISAPGCGASTLAREMAALFGQEGLSVWYFDMNSRTDPSAQMNQLKELCNADGVADQSTVLIIDHSAALNDTSMKVWANNLEEMCNPLAIRRLWIGALDSERLSNDLNVTINDVPKAHISFPLMSREDIFAVYRSISSGAGCNWGESISFLMLDFCGNDFALLNSATEYFHGDWSGKLYDASVWDRLRRWLVESEVVDGYRRELAGLSKDCKRVLDLLRVGGKPRCERAAWFEEADETLRILCLRGFLIQNLLPAFYQTRNLTIRFLIQEPHGQVYGNSAEMIFRRAASERITALVQDFELMLRLVLTPVLAELGDAEAESILRIKQTDREFMSSGLNKALLEWAAATGGSELKDDLSKELLKGRMQFKDDNSVWKRIHTNMAQDGITLEANDSGRFARIAEYLSFKELGDLLVSLLNRIFPQDAESPTDSARRKQRWQESLAKVRRLRNRVAHLRNVSFQDMEDLVGALERMRNDLNKDSIWKG